MKNKVLFGLRKVIGFFLDLFKIEIDINYSELYHHFQKMDDLIYIRISDKIENVRGLIKSMGVYFADADSFIDFVEEVDNIIIPSYINSHPLRGIFIERIWEKKNYKERGFQACFAYKTAMGLLRLLPPQEVVAITSQGSFGKESEYAKKLKDFQKRGVILMGKDSSQDPYQDPYHMVRTYDSGMVETPIEDVRKQAMESLAQRQKQRDGGLAPHVSEPMGVIFNNGTKKRLCGGLYATGQCVLTRNSWIQYGLVESEAKVEKCKYFHGGKCKEKLKINKILVSRHKKVEKKK